MMFKAGTSFNGKSAAEAFSQDFKTVEIQGYTVGISQITVMGMSAIGDMRDGIISHMENIAAGDTYDLLMVIFVDLKEGLTTLRFASGGISEEIKSARFDRLKSLVENQIAENNNKYINTIQKVLVEGPSKGNENMLSGRTDSNKIAVFEGTDNFINKIVNVKITEDHMWYLKGEIVNE